MRVYLFAIATLAASMKLAPASAHDAPSGWTYPLECCSRQDCHELPAAAVEEEVNGYLLKNTGEELAYSDGRLRDSPDGLYHWCATGRRTVCLFIPPKSF